MAIHIHPMQVIGRSQGRSIIAAAAYRSGERLVDKKVYDKETGVWTEMTFDYRNKGHVEYTEIMTPAIAPEWMKERVELWNAVNESEKRVDAQLARELVIAIPKELEKEDGIDLVRRYVKDYYVDKGMVADIAIHWDEGNPHAHVLFSMREITEKGFGKKVRKWNRPGFLKDARELWAEYINSYLMARGFYERVSHLSYKELGIDIDPTVHMGPSATSIEARGESSELGKVAAAVYAENANKLEKNPDVVIDLLASKYSSFTKQDIAKELFKRVGEDQRFNELYTKLLSSKKLIQVVDKDLNDNVRYSTKGYVEAERAALALVERLAARNDHKVPASIIEKTIAKHDLSSEQEAVVRKVLSSGDMAAILGKAGTGKTRSLKVIVEAYQKAGYRVLGSALTGVAAEKLSKDLGIESRTIDSWSYCWKYHKADSPMHLTKKDIMIVDEAGMNDTRMCTRLLEKQVNAGVKAINLGDNDQVKPIGLGQFFRAVIDLVPTGVLEEVWRQKNSKVWAGQDKLISQFADGKVKEVLQALDDNGRVTFGETKQGVIDKAVQSFMSDYREEKYKSNVVIAFTKNDVDRINQEIRATLKREGLLERGSIVATSRGKYEFSKGDRIMLLENENIDLKIKNGMFAKVESLSMGKMKIRLENDGRIVEFNTKDYKAFMHGYAVNTNKMQAETIEKTYFVGGKFDDFHKTYVSLSRHSEDLEIYLSRDEFKDLNAYGTKLYKEVDNALIRDYEIGSHNQAYVDRVKDYKVHVEAAAKDFGEIFKWAKEKNSHVYEHPSWKRFCDKKDRRNALAKEIANDWRMHRLYANELGLRKENIFVHAGFDQFIKTEFDLQREAIVKDAREHKDPMARASAAFQVASQKASFGKIIKTKEDWQKFENVGKEFSKAALAKHDKGGELSLSERFAVTEGLQGQAKQVYATELLGDVSESLRDLRHTEEYLRTERQKLVRWKEEKASSDYKVESLERYLSKVYKDVPEALKRWHAVEKHQGKDAAKKLLVKRPEALGELQGRSYFMLRDKVRAKASRLLKGVAKRFDSHEMYQRQSDTVAKEIKRVEEGRRYQSALTRSEALKETLGIFKYGETEQLKSIASKIVVEKDRITDKARLELLIEEDKQVRDIERELYIDKMNVETQTLNIERSKRLIDNEKKDMGYFVNRGYVNPEPILEKLPASNGAEIEKLLDAELIPDRKFGLTLNTSKKSDKAKQALLNMLGKIRRYEGHITQAERDLVKAQKKVEGWNDKLKKAMVLHKDKQARTQEIVRLRGDKKIEKDLGIKID